MKKLLYSLLFVLTACTSIDCPLDNIVVMTGGLYHSEDGSTFNLDAELAITSGDGNYILYNSELGANSFVIPLRHGVGTDTLLFWMQNQEDQTAVDTLFLTYTDSPHFESVDCPAALFHTLKSARCTSHPLAELPLTLDSVAIVRSLVNYDDIENIKVFMRTTSQQ